MEENKASLNEKVLELEAEQATKVSLQDTLALLQK